MGQCLILLLKVVPRAGIEPATRGFSRLAAKISLCFYLKKYMIFEVCEKLCNGD
jgi:hypothetical protein